MMNAMNNNGLASTVGSMNAMNPNLANVQPSQAAGAVANADSKEGKKAVHVKWAGKTIALGTFPIAEADEKCARAKALTRAWRSTMRPKPNRDWVMLELERLQVRVVSGRLGRRGSGGDDSDSEGDDEEDEKEKKKSKAPSKKNAGKSKKGDDDDSPMNRAPSVLSASQVNLDSELGTKKKDKNPRRNSLVAMAEAAALSGIGGSDDANGDSTGVTSGPAANLLSSSNSMNMNNIGLSVNPNQHYEMLKLHHMNLLNEIQETTLMMNLYQQQQMQQQQQLQNQSALDTPASAADQQLIQLAKQQRLSGGSNPLFDSFYGMGAGSGAMSSQQFPALHPQASQQMGLGALGGSPGTSNQMQALLNQQNLLSGGMMDSSALPGMNNRQNQMFGTDHQNVSLEEQEEMCQARLLKLKQDIAERQRRAEVSSGTSTIDKRGLMGNGDGSSKRAKRDED